MLFSFQSVSKYYANGFGQQCVFNSINFELSAGKFWAITGESGAGKSTLLSMLAGLERPTSGQLLFCGEDITKYHDKKLAIYRNREIGFVFQKPIYIHYLNVLDNIILPSHYHSEITELPRLRRRALEIAELVGLHTHLQKSPSVLSGGELQRLSFARAMLLAPKVIIADEPTSSLDIINSKILLSMLAEQVNRGVTVIMASHDQTALSFACSRIQLFKTESSGAEITVI